MALGEAVCAQDPGGHRAPADRRGLLRTRGGEFLSASDGGGGGGGAVGVKGAG